MRLIDADALMEKIASISNPDMLTIGKVVGIIDTQPTAYDIDEVVKKLKGLTIPIDVNYTRIPLDKAINIVNQLIK